MPLLAQPLRIHDIDDVEAFVRATIAAWTTRHHALLTPDEFDELTADGLALIVEMQTKYQPGHGGADPATSRFSGYCARFFPNKLHAAWHQRHDNHRLATISRTTPEGERTTSRTWIIEPKAGSLTALLDNNPDGTHIAALHTHDPEINDIADKLGQALDHQWARDRALTIQVGTLLGEGETITGISTRLGIRHAEAMACFDRIAQVTDPSAGIRTAA